MVNQKENACSLSWFFSYSQLCSSIPVNTSMSYSKAWFLVSLSFLLLLFVNSSGKIGRKWEWESNPGEKGCSWSLLLLTSLSLSLHLFERSHTNKQTHTHTSFSLVSFLRSGQWIVRWTLLLPCALLVTVLFCVISLLSLLSTLNSILLEFPGGLTWHG